MADAANLEKALDHIAVAPADDEEAPAIPDVREAKDAEDHARLKRNPAHADSKLDIGLDESFPTSDPPATSMPGHADPAPSSGYDEAAEKAREAQKNR